jgi:hypothetical protein
MARPCLTLVNGPIGKAHTAQQQVGDAAIMTVRRPDPRSDMHTRSKVDPARQTPAPQPVPKVVRDATDRFIKKYERTLRDLEKY